LIYFIHKARGLKDPAGVKRRLEEKSRAAKELESGGGGGGGMKVFWPTRHIVPVFCVPGFLGPKFFAVKFT
jgi:hypothetical protein